jgi:hypothetical protein
MCAFQIPQMFLRAHDGKPAASAGAAAFSCDVSSETEGGLEKFPLTRANAEKKISTARE